MEVLDKFLKEQLANLETSGVISVNKVMNMESAVADLDPELSGFITSKIPLSKFSVSETSTNLEEVKLTLKSIIALREETALANDINKHSIDNVINKLNDFIHYITVIQSFIGSCKDIPQTILEGFRHFKFNAINNQDDYAGQFIALNSNVSFIRALVDTDLKDVFCPNGFPKALEDLLTSRTPESEAVDKYGNNIFDTYGNDCLYGVIANLIRAKDGITDFNNCINILLNKFEPMTEESKNAYIPGLTYGYSITLADICSIADNADMLFKQLETTKEKIVRFKNELFGPNYIVYAFNNPSTTYEFGSNVSPASDVLSKDALSNIIDGAWSFEDKEIHMRENHEPLNESFIIIREAFGSKYEH